jgi:hypothetical protein
MGWDVAAENNAMAGFYKGFILNVQFNAKVFRNSIAFYRYFILEWNVPGV